MSLFQKPNPLTDNVERFVAQALSYNGYTASANRINVFGERLGMNGLPWDGIFIDVVAREVGVSLPSHIYPPVALADLFTDVRGLPRGHFDTRTRLAYAKFQRSIGYPPSRATGDVDGASLQRLAEMTGLFTASA